MSQIWDPKNECMSRDMLTQLQTDRLKATLERVNHNVPCYKDKFLKHDVVPADVRSLEDLSKIPFTTKDDLRLNYPYGMFAVPLKDVVRIHSSSGTTGKPTVVGYTRRDLDSWTDLVTRFMTAAGVTQDDIVHIAFGYGLFTGAFGLHYGRKNWRLGHPHVEWQHRKTDHDHAGLSLVGVGLYPLVCVNNGRSYGKARD